MRTSSIAQPTQLLPRWSWFAGAILLSFLYLILLHPPAKAQIDAPLAIPLSATVPKLDGVCAPNDEYADASVQPFVDRNQFQGVVYLKHDAGHLYVCMSGAPGTFDNRFARVYLDVNNGREMVAQSDDRALQVTIIGNALSAYVGSGVPNGYVPDGASGWDAHAAINPAGGGESAEWSIPLELVSQGCGQPFGLAVYHHWLTATGDDYGWPSNEFFDQPQTWQMATLADTPCAPDLVIAKADSADPFSGSVLTYTIDVTNTGNVVATDVVVTDPLPASVHFVAATPASCTHSGEFLGGTVTCLLGELAPGEHQVITVAVAPTQVGAISNTATVTSKQEDANPQDNSATQRTSIKEVVLANLAISKTDSKDPVQVGEVLSYTVEVKNLGPSVAEGVTISDTLPAGLTFVGASSTTPGVTCLEADGLVACNLGVVDNNQTVSIIIVVRANAAGVQLNQATVNSKSPLDPDPADNRAMQETQVEGLSGKIAYVFRNDDVTANDFKGLLESRGFTVQLIRCAAVLPSDFAPFDGIIIADDTGSLNNWCAAAAGVAHIAAPHRPIVGLGEGGYAFFGQLGKPLGWPHGWHGPLDRIKPHHVAASYWHTPTDFGAPPPDPLGLYSAPSNEVGIYLPAVSGVNAFGLEPSATDHAPLLTEQEDCNQLWGFSAGPQTMTADGKNLFVNGVVFALGRPCQAPPPPPQDCVTVVKTANPPAGAPVHPGDTIGYILTVQLKDVAGCEAQRASLEDAIPVGALFIPGSASDGIAPAGGVLTWNIGPLGPGATVSKSFKVYVMDTQCNGDKRIANRARVSTGFGVVVSNIVTHPLDCPPVTPNGTQPPYAEDEIQIYPYPLVTGQATEVSVRLRSLISVTQQVTITFEGSPDRFGIGLGYSALPLAGNPRVVTLPPFAVVEVKLNWTPTTSGHYCIRVRIEGEGFAPIFTYRNLDVMEDLRPGVEDTLPFAVRNPKATTENMQLVVDNTCPGWTAFVDPTSLLAMAPGEVRTATLHVTPPTDRPLGTACHIDVQGWIGDELIGGIRKLDVPPVHLPPSEPSWLEKEISAIPDPPVVGQPGQLCVELQNPMPFDRTVSVDFAVADFGAGVPFTPVGSLNNITLPANSIAKYCINWTPTAGGTLHRCALVTLHQEGFADQRSQRNLDLVRTTCRSIACLLGIEIPFTVGNTAGFTKTLQVKPVLVGLPPIVIPHILPDPPPELQPGEQRQFVLKLEMAGAADTAQAATGSQGGGDDAFANGDVVRIDVGVQLDDQDAGGFSVEFSPPEQSQLYLPLVAN